jgi:two-component system cell cycle sensor histidine kinase/response regulator CckA
VSDITQRRHAEDENAALQVGLNQAQKMESVGRLAGGVAHDLNNTLMPILGYGEILLGNLSSDDARRRYAELMVRSAEHARDLVHQLLVFGHQKAGASDPIELNDAVAGIAEVLREPMRDDITVAFISCPRRLAISGDKFQLQQVITNLATNAEDAMPQGGVLTIEISLTEVGASGAATREDLAPGRYALLTVSDTGFGMSAETLSHVFEPFFTTKAVGKGVGLGLAAVHGIVKQHGGAIAVASEAGRGTTFKIWLPAID